MTRVVGWALYVCAWAVAGAVWSVVAGRAAGMAIASALPYGITAMTVAGVLGIGVWHLSGRLTWSPRSIRFFGAHVAAVALYSPAYATSAVWIDLVAGRGLSGLPAIVASPTFIWNLLFGLWLYAAIAGVAYAIRSQHDVAAARLAALRAEALVSEARLAALRARVNPHFLFNALHSVGALVSLDPRRAERAIERLGDLLRYTLSPREVVPLRDEWQFTRDYLEIEALRLGERLRTSLHVDDAALVVPVPALVLQPLVENAIRHGIADRAEGGMLAMSASVNDGVLRLRVDDDGGSASSAGGHGTGLATLGERLRAHYGDAASLDARPHDRGFTVDVQIPIVSDLSPEEDA